MRAIFVVNRRSGKRRDFDVEPLIRRACGSWELEVISCQAKEDLDAIVARAEAEEVDALYAVGGDGTVHETAKRLIGRRVALGVVPTGSGNGFARHLGLPMDPEASLRACARGRTLIIDTAEVNGAPFVGVMGIGFDAVIAERFAASSVRGLETYVKEGLRLFAGLQPETYEIETPVAVERRSAFVIAVANSGQYGNNARIAPLASLRDGLLDLVVVDNVSLVAAPLLLARLFFGSFHRAAGVRITQTPEVTIRRTAEGPAHLDGEPVTLPAELHIRIRPASLRVVVPDAAGAI